MAFPYQMCNHDNLFNTEDKKSSKKFDHREFGVEKQFFCSPHEGGSGFPFWLPNGYKLTEIIRNYVNEFQQKCEIKLVKTPILGKRELYCKTGHLPLYSENIFSSVKDGEEEYILRPMTCPHHILLAKETIQGYRQLPYLIGENSILHRREYSGGLIGLKRVRSMELIDTHIFVTPEQSRTYIVKCLGGVGTLLKKFQIEIKEIVLATKSEKEKYVLENEEWAKTEEILFSCVRNGASQEGISSKLILRAGDAAFYGPKIDFNAVDSSNQTFTISTIQLDSGMSKKLGFNIVDAAQKTFFPGIIHLGLIGTLERFVAYLLEKGEGTFPFGLSPVQIIVIPVECPKFLEDSKKLGNKLIQLGFRVEIESGKERFSRKIFDSIQKRIPIQVVIGEKEVKNPDLISFREIGSRELKILKFEDFVDYLNKLEE